MKCHVCPKEAEVVVITSDEIEPVCHKCAGRIWAAYTFLGVSVEFGNLFDLKPLKMDIKFDPNAEPLFKGDLPDEPIYLFGETSIEIHDPDGVFDEPK